MKAVTRSDGPLLSFYGDDFTGSTDVMEALSSNGVPTVLFTSIPNEDQAARFADCRAVGIAGTSRSQSPAWMDQERPAIFEWLKALNARYCHYKTCSTFDSAPTQGSVGRALEIGLRTFAQRQAAMILGAPQLRRYSYFGQLFASYRDKVYRLDRHPVMRRHPATPMREADLLEHLAQQTELATACLDPEFLSSASIKLPSFEEDQIRCLLIDVYDADSQERAGVLLDKNRDRLGPFVVGSSGVEYALLKAWEKAGNTDAKEKPEPLEKHARIAVVSGSCSLTTAHQIDTALADGFDGIELDYQTLISGQGLEIACEKALAEASEVLEAGRSPLIYTARGPGNLAGAATSAAEQSGDRVGRALGRILSSLIKRHGLKRVIVAGGDTSSHALSELKLYALTLRHPIPATPGSPLCTAYRNDGGTLELALKGGQIGGGDYFLRLRDGALSL